MNRGVFSGINANLAQQLLVPIVPFDGPYFNAGQIPPLAANFTTFGANITGVNDKIGRLQFAVNSGTVLNGLTQASISTPYTIDAHLGYAGTPAASDASALGIAVSDGTKYRALYVYAINTAANTNSGTVRGVIDSWTSSTVFGTTLRAFSISVDPSNYYARITDDGTTRRLYVSANGLDFFQLYNEATNTLLTPTKFAIVCYNNAAGSLQSKASIYNWVVTASVLGDAA